MLNEAKQLPLADLRHEIHRHPELGRHEYRTAALVEQTLQSLGIETVRICDTAVVGTLCGAFPGKTVALRADMDALPITEATGCAFSSEEAGLMHACGHDCHTTALLGAAMLLSAHREELHGQVKFFFQPDEEGDGGAKRMIEAGCLENPHVDAVFGMHVAPDLSVGTVGVRYGKFYAASNMFRAVVKGKSCHGAEPENGINALLAAAEMVTALHDLQERMREKYGPLIITVGKLVSGTAVNILPGEAEFAGIVRTLGPDARSETMHELQRMLEEISAKHGTVLELTLRESYPGVVNHDEETALAEQCTARLFGAEQVTRLPHPTMTTEDFGYFLQETGGSFLAFGVGGDTPLHNPLFLPDDSLLAPMAALEASLALEFLSI